MSQSKDILAQLRKRGHRITPVRAAMIRVLGRTPCSAKHLLRKLAARNVKANKSTVYRELLFLLNENIIQEVVFGDGTKRYEIAESHHHHVVCVTCKVVQDVTMKEDIDATEKTIARQKGFKILNHSLEFFGLCANCRA